MMEACEVEGTAPTGKGSESLNGQWVKRRRDVEGGRKSQKRQLSGEAMS